MMINVFLTNLGKYNEGELVGKWISLPISENDLENAMDEIGINEEYEEYFITDYETDIDGFEIGEYANLEELNELAEELENMDDSDAKAFVACIQIGRNADEALECVMNGDYRIYYNCSDTTDVAYEVVEECGYLKNVPEQVKNYFDYESFGRDLDIEGNYVYVDGDYVEIF